MIQGLRWNTSHTGGGDCRQANIIRKERFRWDQQHEQCTWVEKRSSKRSEGWVEKRSSRRSATTAVKDGSSSNSDGREAAFEDESSGNESSGSSSGRAN